MTQNLAKMYNYNTCWLYSPRKDTVAVPDRVHKSKVSEKQNIHFLVSVTIIRLFGNSKKPYNGSGWVRRFVGKLTSGWKFPSQPFTSSYQAVMRIFNYLQISEEEHIDPAIKNSSDFSWFKLWFTSL